MVGVVTDSAANLPPHLLEGLPVRVVPLTLVLGEEAYRDGQDITLAEFYRRLGRGVELATTSAASPEAWLEGFEGAGTEEVVCITVAASMSSNHHHAVLAAQRFPGRVEVVDSRSASMAEGFVVLEAARLAAQGASLEAVAARAREVADRTRLYAMVETFEHLRRSGRVSKLQAYAATMLDIKPVFVFRGGEVAPVGRARTRRKALARMVEECVAEVGDRPAHVAAVHAAAEEDARAVLEAVAERANVVERLVTEVTPVIGAHVGPGLVGLAFYCD
ncbi:MAG TPA: DegV family protein [Actinomycetota bacterium]|nr:DegV family protein [Actinomycetota bacterium]